MAAFKQGIPLLDAFEEGTDNDQDEDTYDEPEYDYSGSTSRKRSLNLRALCTKRILIIILVTVIISAVLLTCVIAIPAALIHFNNRPMEVEPLGDVVTSTLDTKQYQAIILPNQLRVLLVSDNETDESSAAMDVAVGSFSNPHEFQGLAHFCEHMLFYANEKYPKEGEYADFLSSHGGYDNAYTSTQNTNYHFKVDSNYLHEALDRFAQFFISPTFSSDAVSREVNAVDSEHRKNLQSDGWRQWQLMKQVSNPNHPFHMFSTGDLSTLVKPGLLDNLKQFYSTYYSANEMQLVIYGKEDLRTLMGYAEEIFTSIENKDLTRPGFAPNVSFPSGYNGKIVYSIPVADVSSVTVMFEVPPLISRYREQIAQFLSYLLSDQSHGSILDSLMKHNWALDLSADVEVDTDTYTLMVVSVTLTDSGLRSISDIIGTVFQYVSVISSASSDTLKQKWDDYVSVKSLNFKYAPKYDPDTFTSNVASQMRNVVKPADFLSPPSRYTYNETGIRQILSLLVPANAVIFASSRTFANMSMVQQDSLHPLPVPTSLSKTEPIYGTQYEEVDITTALKSYWSGYTSASVSLPKSLDNVIPKNFTILPSTTATPKVPTNVNQGDGLSVWWLQDTKYLTPKTNMYCNIINQPTDYSNYDPKWAALTNLYTTLVTSVLRPDLYPLTLTGYDVKVTPTTNGISLQIKGFSDPDVMENLMKIVVNALRNESLLGEQSVFELSLGSLISDLVNYNFTSLPYRYVYQYYQSNVMDRPKWKNSQLLAELRDSSSITTTALLNHMRSLLYNGSSLMCFNHGNIGKSESIKLSSIIHSALTDHTPVSPMGQYYSWRVSLSPGTTYSVIVPTLNPDDINSVVNVVFQIGVKCDVVSLDGAQKCSSASLKRSTLLNLLTLQMKQTCFDVLRSTLQLGYVAYCTSRVNNNIYSFQVLVQSGTYNSSHILNEINWFLSSHENTLSQYLSTEGNFETLQAVLTNVAQIDPLSLSDATDAYWTQIYTGSEQFNYPQQIVNATKTVTADDLLKFYRDNILNESLAKKLVVAVNGQGLESVLDDWEFDYDIDYIHLDPRTTTYP